MSERSVLLLLWGVFGLLLLSLAGVVSGQAKTKPVTTHLSAKWGHTPLLMEAAEYMAEENGANFWSFVEAVAEKDPKIFSYGWFIQFYIINICTNQFTNIYLKLHHINYMF